MSQLRSSLLSYALRLLNIRERFSGELEKKLYQKAEDLKIDDPVALIDQIIQDLKKDKFLNDQKLFASFINYQLTEKVRGPLHIKQSLIRRGVSRSDAEAAIKTNYDPHKERQALKKYLGKHSKSMDPRAKNRLIRRLLSRGFSYASLKGLFDLSLFEE